MAAKKKTKAKKRSTRPMSMNKTDLIESAGSGASSGGTTSGTSKVPKFKPGKGLR